MREPYAPTTGQVREFWASDGKMLPAAKSYERRAAIAEFDRWLGQVRAVARREGQAEAWDECATESGYRGWMHDYAVTEMQERNPYWNGADQ